MQWRLLLKIIIIPLSFVFLGFQTMNLELEAVGTRFLLLLLLLTVLYCIKVETKRLFFLLFLIAFLLGEFVGVMSYFIKFGESIRSDYFYYAGNSLYILAYIFLIIRVLSDMDLMDVLKKFWIHLAILIVLDVFCVVILSGTTEKYLTGISFTLESFYNVIIMILLTVAMINYMSKNSLKSMNLLLGAIFIFFSEVIQLTYFYISNSTILNVMCSVFLVLAFLFFYLQARIPLESEQLAIQQDLRA